MVTKKRFFIAIFCPTLNEKKPNRMHFFGGGGVSPLSPIQVLLIRFNYGSTVLQTRKSQPVTIKDVFYPPLFQVVHHQSPVRVPHHHHPLHHHHHLPHLLHQHQPPPLLLLRVRLPVLLQSARNDNVKNGGVLRIKTPTIGIVTKRCRE